MVLGLLLFFVGAVGCKQQCFLTECDYDHYRNLYPESLDCSAGACVQPENVNMAAPATVLSPDRPIRYMSLAEAISIALEQGHLGSQGLQLAAATGGVANIIIDLPLTAAGGAVRGGDSIRIFALDPAIAQTDIESSLSKFDARWVTSMTWQNTDQPVATALQNFQAVGTGVATIEQNQATFSSALVKPLPTGGVAGITFRTDYTLSNLAQRVNPAYVPSLQFGFEQPLFQGFGTEINQIRSSHPGSQLFQFNNVARTPGILITRLTFDEDRTQFEFNVAFMLVQVEAAYWNLYNSYWTLYTREQALRQAYEAWRINKARFEAGRIPVQDFAQTRGQYELFREQRIEALGAVLENERLLRGVLNLQVEDGTRLVPIDSPTVAPFTPDWQGSLNEAMSLQYTLILGRDDVKVQQLNLINEKNLLLPDVRFTSTYDFNAIGTRLDGPAPNNAFRNLEDGRFSNWSLGLRAEIPLGYRDAHAAVRQQRLRLAQSYIQLRDQEIKVQNFLARQYRNIFEFQERIKALRAQREAFAQQLSARFKEFLAGRGTLDFLLESQRNWADALAQEYTNITQYNIVLAGFEFAKGTLLQYDNVVISEGALPRCAQVRAVEHEKERSKALILHEHAQPVEHPVGCASVALADPQLPALPQDIAGLPQLPHDRAPSLPALVAKEPKIPDIKDLPPAEAQNYLSRRTPLETAPAFSTKPAAFLNESTPTPPAPGTAPPEGRSKQAAWATPRAPQPADDPRKDSQPAILSLGDVLKVPPAQ
jgi:outer membrane protein TolC